MVKRWSPPSRVTPLDGNSAKVGWQDLKLGPGEDFLGKTQTRVGKDAGLLQGDRGPVLSQPSPHLHPDQCSSLWELYMDNASFKDCIEKTQ